MPQLIVHMTETRFVVRYANHIASSRHHGRSEKSRTSHALLESGRSIESDTFRGLSVNGLGQELAV